MNYAELKQKPQILQSLTGMRVKEFETLLISFEQAWSEFVAETFTTDVI